MTKQNNKLKNVINNMPVAFAYHKVIYDQNNNPVDYIFKEVNNKFEELTGLKREQLIGKKATTVLEDIKKYEFNWIQFYGELALSKESKTNEKYIKAFDKWFEVKAYSEKKGFFTTVFTDITERKLKEQKLKQEKQRLNNIFNHLNDIVWSISWPDLEVQFISRAVEDIVGYSTAEFKNDPNLLYKITHPEDKHINERALKQLAEEGYTEREFRVISKDGNIIWIQDKGEMIYDENHNPIRVEGVMRDVTKRKQAEQQLKYNQQRYEAIFQNDPIGIIIEDNKGNILEVNDKECEMTGYTKEELEGKNVIDMFVLPEYHELAKENIKKIIAGQDLEFDIKTPTKNGEIKYMHLKETNITFPDGKKGIISMHVDITERKKMEKELKMMDFTINKADILIFRVTPDGKIDYVNETAVNKLGYTKNELIGLQTNNIIYDDNYIQRAKFWEEIKSSGSKIFELYFETKNNKTFPVEIVSQYYQYEDKEYEFAFVQDISERKEKEERIQYLLHKDSLTGLYNRRFFEIEMDRLDTERQLPISIIMCDVNGLKIINDSYGHKKGDQILTETAQILENVVRDEDIIARHGGDEFTLLLPQTTYEQGQKLIERIKKHTKTVGEEEIPISMSLGIATKTRVKEDIEETLKKADNAMYRNKLSESRSTKNKIVRNLLNTLEAKSSETKEHAVRMAKLANELGEHINLSNSELNRLNLLATLHDIGKTTISEDILTKPGKLTKEEWEIIQEHTETGYKIASASEEFAVVAEEILFHHEKWDGTGYPQGIAGEEIPYLARIIAIIDAYDVMTNDRPYSKAISKKAALSEIRRCSGSQFDPNLTKAFIQLQQENI
jgi:diguanylate cyclase (GGDEF)-like protein/PAS domain S-box-containing protein